MARWRLANSLDDPNDTWQESYKFLGADLEYKREDVINHRHDAEGILKPGDAVTGFLLVQGFQNIPFDLFRCNPIPVTVVVVDAKDRAHRSTHTFVMPLPNRSVTLPVSTESDRTQEMTGSTSRLAGTEHAVEVTAESLYEAVAQALGILRGDILARG